LLNVSYDADGEYQPRLGYTQLATPQRVSRLYTKDAELLLTDGHFLESFNTGPGSFATKDTVPEYRVTHAGLFNTSSNFQSFSEVYASGYRVVAWVDANDHFFRAIVLDATTGAVVYGPTILSTTTGVNCALGVVGATAIAIVATSAPSVLGFTLALSSLGSWSGATTLSDAFLLATGGIFGAAFLSSTFIVAYQNGVSGANQSLRLRSFNAALALQSNTTATSTLTGPFNTIAVAGTSGGSAYVAATSSGGTAGNILVQIDASALTTTGSTSMSTPGNIGNTTVAMSQNAVAASVVMTGSASCVWALESLGPCIAWGVFTATTQTGSTQGAVGCGLSSGLLYTAGAQNVTTLCFVRIVTAGAGSSYSGTFVLVDLQTALSLGSNPRWLATLAPAAAQNSLFASSPNLPPLLSGPNGYECALAIMRTSNGRQGLDLFTLTASSPHAAALGRELYLGGSYYDGVTLVEDGFTSPPQLSLAVNTTGNTSYQYAVTWARIDAQGNLEESAPSQILTLTTSANPPNNSVTAVCLHVTNKLRSNAASFGAASASGSNVFMVVYRTPNLANGDTTLYRVTKDPFPSNCVSSVAAPSLSYTDTMADGTLTDGTHPVLYTVSGELAHNPPESPTHVVSHKDRVWSIAADQRTIWFSQTYVDGSVPAWNVLQSFSVDDANEPLIALASLYDKLLIFTRSRVYVVYGDGPSPAGTNSDLQPPQVVPTAVGCLDRRSVVLTPLGIMYQSTRGIELLDNGLNPQFIGMPVSVTTATYPICTSAVMCGNTSTVRFTFVTSEAYPLPSNAVGRTVVYDLRRNLWTVHSLGGGSDAPVESAVYHPTLGYVIGQTVANANSATVSRESTTADAAPWLDGSTPQTMSVTTAWVKSGDLQGWQKVRRVFLLAKYYDQHSLNVSFEYNYSSSLESHAFAANVVANIVSGTLEQVRMIPAAGRSQSIQTTIAVTALANTSGRACGLTGLAYEVHPQKGGMRDIPAAAEN